jgi:hypothetical protein
MAAAVEAVDGPLVNGRRRQRHYRRSGDLDRVRASMNTLGDTHPAPGSDSGCHAGGFEADRGEPGGVGRRERRVGMFSF